MSQPTTKHEARKPGFSSISRQVIPFIDGKTSTPPASKAQSRAPHLEIDHRRHPYLLAREAITMGVISSLFILTAITSELIARFAPLQWWNIAILLLALPLVFFISIHLLTFLAVQCLRVIERVTGTKSPGSRDQLRGVSVLGILTIYACYRIFQPAHDGFTPIAWIWAGIWSIDLIGRAIERITSHHPTKTR